MSLNFLVMQWWLTENIQVMSVEECNVRQTDSGKVL